MDYRREIDGLRAISVVSVVIYHANFVIGDVHLLPGGFVGVDIFFVISGFLITRLIAAELANNRFTILRFYERRVRRILPALIVVILASVPFAFTLMNPKALQEFSASVVSTLLFYSNFQFWFQDSYWAEPNKLKPLLHTWSLSVEEQFYIFFPPLMIALSGVTRTLRLSVFLGLALFSLGLAQYLSTRFVDANFFLTLTRVWELMCGALLALLPARNQPLFRLAGQYLPTLGLAVILVAAVTFTETMPHPSLYTALPVLGAVAIIGRANKNDPATKMLASPVFVGIGLISYSFYLWHYPVFAFARIWSDQDISTMGLVILIIVSGLLAGATYRWIEQPFRNADRISLRNLVYIFGSLSAVLVMTAGYIAQRDVGEIYSEIPAKTLKSFQVFSDPDERIERCVDQSDYANPEQWCRVGRSHGDIEFLLVGDSHAEAVASVFHSAALDIGLRGLLVSRSGCPLLLDLEPNRGEPLSQQCLKLGKFILEFAETHGIGRVIFASRWNYYYCGSPQPSCGYSQDTRFKDSGWGKSKEELSGYLQAALQVTLEAYEAKNISTAFMAQVPHQLHDPLDVYKLAYEASEPALLTNMAVSFEDHQAFTGHVRSLMNAAINAVPAASWYDPADVLCKSNGVCLLGDAGQSYYSDDNHPSIGIASILMDWAKLLLE